MKWCDRKHINSPQQIVNLDNRCHRDRLSAILVMRMLVDREYNIQMFVEISRQHLIGELEMSVNIPTLSPGE